jgi:hypothetical protein
MLKVVGGVTEDQRAHVAAQQLDQLSLTPAAIIAELEPFTDAQS